MKKTVLLLVTVAVFCGCGKKYIRDVDYNGYGYAVWINDSDHTIKITGYSFYNSAVEMEEEIAPGEIFTVMKIGMASTPCPISSKISVLFDGENKVTFHSVFGEDETRKGVPTDYDDRLRLNRSTNYKEEEVKNPEGCKQCAGARWTYTFTNDDFIAALEYNEAQAAAE